ncbi:MAG: NUDIX-like domain-containing protein, partial [Pseudomonadota bacterium]
MSLPAEITFAARTHQIDRASHMRPMADDLLMHRRAVMLPIWRGKLLTVPGRDGPELGWAPPLRSHLAQAAGTPVFLGMSGETPCFAADFSDLSEDRAGAMFRNAGTFTDLRAVAAELTPSSATIAAT